MTAASDDDALPSGARPPVGLLMAFVLAGVLAINVYVPALPEIRRELNASPTEIQLTLTVFLVAFGLAQLVLGPMSDRFGRRPILLWGTALFVVANIVCALAFSIEALLFGRVLQAFGACAGSVVTRALVRDAWGRDRSASIMGFLTLSISLGAAVSPLIGGLLAARFGWTSGFWFLAAVGAVPVIVGIFRLTETNRHIGRPMSILRIAGDLRRLCAYPPYLGYSLSVGAMNGMFFVFLGSAPFVLIEHLGMRPDTFGVFMLVMVAGSLIGAAVATRYGARPWGATLLTVGTLCSLAGGLVIAGLGFAGLTTIPGVIAPLFLVGLGNGGMMPIAAARAVGLAPKLAGTASAGFGAIQLLGGAIGTVVAGLLPHESQGPMGAGMVAFALFGLASTVLARRGGTPTF
ncbi:MAG: multidrug effflux MFS transporter [Proteobacteria bacterium]|nr:multidrug effflux MFS transporter [Pseudomonadota bacterium]MDA1059781.1 multidrug effflux MFS transporter [Pseudomonadota bacterium]